MSADLLRACVALASIACASVASAADVTQAATGATGTPGANSAATGDVPAAPTTFGPGGVSPAGASPGDVGVARTNFFTYGADAGIGYSDNITETSTDKRSDEILAEGIQLAGLEQGARFQGAVLADLEHLNYLQGTYSPEVIGNFGGYAAYALVPDFVRWMAQDSFGQGLVDPFASQSPGNLENINTITTGPTFTIPLGNLTLLNVSARYSRVSYQVSPLDNNDYGGAVTLTRLLSARSSISFNVQSERYDYTDPINPSYDQREAFARYDIQGARTRITVDAGYDQIRGPQQLDSSGVLGRLRVSRTLAEGSVLSISAGREPSNSSSFLAQNQAVSGIGLQATSGQQTATPFSNEYETLGWSFSRRRTTLSLILSHYEQIYDGQSILDQSYTSGGVHLSRLMYPGWTVGLFADYSKESFAQQLAAQQSGNYTEEHGGANVRWQLARKLALTFEYDHYHRNSDLVLYSFSENRVWMRVQYGTGAPNGSLGTGSESAALGVINTDRFNIPAPTH
jgi:hypothetical protein